VNQAPKGIILLLGLNHKFCICCSLPPTNFLQTKERFVRSIRLQHWLLENPPEPLDDGDTGYIPKIYVPSDFVPPKIDSDNTELAMMTMFEEIEHAA
jgi:hypothetical protein